MKYILKNLLYHYKKMSAPVKASLWFTVCNVTNKGLALLSTPILTRILSQEQYGIFSVYQSWVSIITIFASMNLYQSAFTKGLVKYKTDKEGLSSSLLSLSSLITFGYFCIFLISPHFWSSIFNISPLLIGTIFIEIFFMSAYEFWAARQRFDYKYKLLVTLSIIITIGSLGLGIVAVINTEYKVEARIFSDIFIKSLIGLVLFILIIVRGKCIVSKEYWKYGFLFNIPLLPHFLSHFILNQSDRIMISNMVGNKQAAIYSIAYSIAMMMLLITGAVNNSFTPYTYKNLEENKLNLISKNATPLFVLVSLLCVLTMIVGPEIIELFAGDKYAEAIWIIPPIAASVYFIFVYSMFANIEYYYKKTISISAASVMCAVLNLALNYIFIRKFGYFAAGYTTLLSYIILSFVHYIFYRRTVKKFYGGGKEIYNIRIINIGAVSVLIMLMLMLLSYNFILLRILVLISIIMFFLAKKDFLTETLKNR